VSETILSFPRVFRRSPTSSSIGAEYRIPRPPIELAIGRLLSVFMASGACVWGGMRYTKVCMESSAGPSD
jgi:hypothetical protein